MESEKIRMSNVIYQMLLLFMMMTVGYIANKTKIMDAESNKKISRLVINITSPAIVLDSVIGNNIENKVEVILVFVLATIPYIIFPILSKFVVKLLKTPKKREGTLEAMLVFSNMGFMGIPVISGIYGSDAIFYVSIFMLMFNLAFFSYGISILSEKKDNNKVNFRNIVNPGVVVSIIAVFIFIFEIPVPAILAEGVDLIGNVTTPLVMLVIGSTIAPVPIKEVFLEKKLYLITLLRLMVYPVIIWLLLNKFITNQTLLGVTVLLSGMPTAANVVMACNEYGGDAEFVSKGIFFTTLGSLLTIPILTLLIG